MYSFLNQDYRGEKELLLLNDFDRQWIVFDHPQVTVVNIGRRFRTLGEKRNAAAALARYDLLAVWDDDDIYLPHRLTFSAQRYDAQKRFFKPSRAFYLDAGVISGPAAACFHAGSMWHRSLFDEVGGYPHMGSGEDARLEERFAGSIGGDIEYNAIKPDEIYYIYRWGGTESYHISGFGDHGLGEPGHERVKEYALRAVSEGKVPSGEIVLHPHWSVDYERLVREHLAVRMSAPKAIRATETASGGCGERETARPGRGREC